MGKKTFSIIVILSLAILMAWFSFSKIWGRSDKKQEVARDLETECRDDWDFYFSNVDGRLASLFVNIGLYNAAPFADKPNVAWVSIKMNDPNADGLSSQGESDKLFEIEDALAKAMAAKSNSVYVGRLTSAGRRDFYFYSGDTDLYENTLSSVMSAYPDYKFDFGIKEDKEWKGYLDFLYPSPRQLESIYNRRTVAQLEKNGDNLTAERDVFHWIYFKTETDLEKFLDKIKGNDFAVVARNRNDSQGEYPWGLQIKRKDRVDPASVDEYTLYLWDIAVETNGEYDGWETSVEK